MSVQVVFRIEKLDKKYHLKLVKRANTASQNSCPQKLHTYGSFFFFSADPCPKQPRIECSLEMCLLLCGVYFHITKSIFTLSSLPNHLDAKYLVFVSSRFLKTRELSFAQFGNFLRKVCLFLNFE
jgi:hypothetical protein